MPTTAREVMTREVVTIDAAASIADFVERIRETSFSGLPVLEDGRAVGLVSQNDVLRALAAACSPGEPEERRDRLQRRASAFLLEVAEAHRRSVEVTALLARPVRSLVARALVSCAPETPLSAVCSAMLTERVHRVVVVDDAGAVVGIISALDLVGVLRDRC